jgi:hypothetical protein
MAVIANQLGSRLQLRLVEGTDNEGKEIIKTRTLNNVKAGASDEDTMDVAEALTDLQKYPVSSIVRTNEYELIREV